MSSDLLSGKLVRLTAEESKTLAESNSHWSQDTELWRLMTTYPARPYSVWACQRDLEKSLEQEPPANSFYFNIRSLQEDLLIGDVGLDGVMWSRGESFVGIGINDRAHWGKGYGTDAMRLILRFAFLELNLRRVSLNTFGYNPRAIRSYEKAGFVHEGRMRNFLLRDGQRYDLIYMGILKGEWMQKEKEEI